MDFSEKLRIVMTEAPQHLTQEVVAHAIGVSRSHVSSLLSGRRRPSRGLEQKLLNKLGINIEWWETGRGRIFQDDQIIFELNQEFLRSKITTDRFLPESLAIAESVDELLSELTQRERTKTANCVFDFIEQLAKQINKS
ncbi:helix-turn-helix domain-containing protein [Desulfurivibrio alkaliphilus]|uniref:helix-turn-helix domain-containing protein n=1 Tax=Desulfurivibrio alkaliphilus TaxID=427923 RepID=UPI0009FCD9CB|nr:helix-turn-helix transcriptional regulator [Desulfurivibrio alkaliphilus]